jgi:2-polyprenyl-6-methoxyphenol hydroxylase-like FAD-dependent oxidoreductase
MERFFDVVIIGGGMGGLVLAEVLSRKGCRTAILERQPHFSPILRGEIIQPNGLRVLDQLGLLQEVKAAGPYLNHLFHFYRVGGSRLCTVDYRMLPPPYHYALITLPELLLGVLLKRISGKPEIQVHWGTEFQTFLRDGGKVVGVQADNRIKGQGLYLKAPVVVGADGVYSKVRSEMRIPYRLKCYRHGYLTLFLKRPASFGQEGRYYVGRKEILGIFPVSEVLLYLFYLVPVDDQLRLKDRPGSLEAIKKAIETIDPVVKEALGDITSWEQIGYMPCRKVKAVRWVADGVALMGDAAHAMNPHVSQGRNQALEDAMVLSEVIMECFRRGDFSRKALMTYQDARRMRVEKLQRLADEQVFFWNAGDPIRTWLRDRVFRTMDQNARLRYRMLAQVAGLQVRPYSLLDYLKAGGFFPDIRANQWP